MHDGERHFKIRIPVTRLSNARKTLRALHNIASYVTNAVWCLPLPFRFLYS